MKVKILNKEQIKAAGGDWDRLLLSSRLPSPFCSLDIILPWLDHYAREYDPVLLGVYENGSAKGFMPLGLSKAGLLNSRALTFCGSSELYSDHLDMISSEQDAGVCLEAILDFLQGESLSWEMFNISLVSSESALMRQAPTFSVMSWEVREMSVSPYIDLSGGFDAFMSGFNGKHRYTLKKKVRKLSEQGFSYKACSPDAVEAGIHELFELHRLRAASKGIDSTFHGETLLSLHKAVASSLSSKGRLWLRFLEREDKKIAAFYGFELGNRLFYYQFGIDPEWEIYSPGTVLIYNVIEETFSKGLGEFDFLRGSEAYKNDWTNNKRALYSMKSYRKNVRGDLLKTVFRSKDFLKKNVRRLIS